jgi:STE24 endopeptidase
MTDDLARRYQRAKLAIGTIEIAISVVAALLLIVSGWTIELRDFANAVTRAGPAALCIYVLVALGALAVLTAPLDFYSGFVLEHRYGLGRQTARSWAFDWLKMASLEMVLAIALVEIVYALIAVDPMLWWLFAGAALTLIAILLSYAAPVLILPLFARFKPLTDAGLRDRIMRLSERLGVRVGGVYVWGMREKTRKANAAVSGWGYSRRILVADTLLESHSADEIEVIIAHEIGHQVHGDIWRGIALQAVLTFAGFYALHVAFDAWSGPLGFEGPGDIAGLPLLGLVAIALGAAALPLVNTFSRARERAADAFALRATGMAESFISAMEKLGRQNLSETRPHPLIEAVFHSHPSIEKRVAFARAWVAEMTPSDPHLMR